MHKFWHPGILAARKWRENEEMERKWRDNEEMERKWRENEEMERKWTEMRKRREIHSLHFPISSLPIHFLYQKLSHFVAKY